MATKTTGAEFKKFYSDNEWWPAGFWHEDEEITIDGELASEDADLSKVADNARMVLAHGCVHDDNEDIIGSFEVYFRKWRRKQSFVFFAVEVPRDKAKAVRSAVIAAGGKVKG